jgi:hypothetical protein
MAKDPIYLEIAGLKQLQQQLDQKAQDLAREVDAEIGFAAADIAGRAKATVQATISNTGFLAGGITEARERELQWKVTSVRRYSPYVEFGTGALVSVPPDLSSYAIQFKGAGIRQVNLISRPYLFPAFAGATQPLLTRLDTIINNFPPAGAPGF